ncbi:DUF4190 domain-containing protein [Streptomycetaceae bacterium NBC_01309]
MSDGWGDTPQDPQSGPERHQGHPQGPPDHDPRQYPQPPQQPLGPYPPQYPPNYPPPYGYMVQGPGTNGLAIASLVLGIVWVYWVTSLLAVIFGHIALVQINQTGQSGRGMAIAGLVLGYVWIALLMFAILFAAAIIDDLDGRMLSEALSAVTLRI